MRPPIYFKDTQNRTILPLHYRPHCVFVNVNMMSSRKLGQENKKEEELRERQGSFTEKHILQKLLNLSS
jgi:hypothetical protein